MIVLATAKIVIIPGFGCPRLSHPSHTFCGTGQAQGLNRPCSRNRPHLRGRGHKLNLDLSLQMPVILWNAGTFAIMYKYINAYQKLYLRIHTSLLTKNH